MMLSIPWVPMSGYVHATDRVVKLVQNGASAMMKSAIWYCSFCTFIARKYATGKPKTRQAATAIRVPSCGSGVEELDIFLLPRDADLLTLLAPEGGIALAGHLRQHAVASRCQMELDQIAEELDEHDLALDGVARGPVARVLHL